MVYTQRPKDFCVNTVESVDGYPKYRCRHNGATVKVHNVDVDNRWVVSYNPWLLQKYGVHINVEACMSVKFVEYLYKYICDRILENQPYGHI